MEPLPKRRKGRGGKGRDERQRTERVKVGKEEYRRRGERRKETGGKKQE